MENNEEEKYDKLRKWYTQEQSTFQLLAEKVANLIKFILDENKIEYHSITFRAKDIESLINKAKTKKYKNPIEEIQDFAGIRIITFVKSDVIKACNLIKPHFIIDEENSSDKSVELGVDKVGYRSIHYIAKFNEERTSLYEYSYFKDKCFEIQIRTILEHAWADISHDRTYKFNNSLPEKNDIRRRFALAAASLEMIDREFDRLSNEIEEYSLEIKNKTNSEETLMYDIDGTSLDTYLKSKLKDAIENGIINPTFLDGQDLVIKELEIMGIRTLDKLDNIIEELGCTPKISLISSTFAGFLRNIMIVYDSSKYFKEAWRSSWFVMEKETADVLLDLGVNLKQISMKENIKIFID